MRIANTKLSIKLKDLGFPQNTHFAHYFNAGKDTEALVENNHYKDADTAFRFNKLIAAPTTDEILDLLPGKISLVDEDDIYYMQIKHDKKWSISYFQFGQDELAAQFSDDNLLDAAAKMWMELKEEYLL